MATLGREASSVVEAGRSALRPTDADRERVEAALRARLGLNALPLAPTSAPGPRAASFVRRFFAPALGVGVIGGVLFLGIHVLGIHAAPVPKQAASPPPSAVATANPTNAVASAEPAAPEVTAPSPPEPALLKPANAPATKPRDQLAREVALLSRATSALSSGRASDALRALNEHQREFPNGLLSQERRAAKARALCSLGRVSEGRAELAHLSPQSPAAARAKQACDSKSR